MLNVKTEIFNHVRNTVIWWKGREYKKQKHMKLLGTPGKIQTRRGTLETIRYKPLPKHEPSKAVVPESGWLEIP